MKYSSMLVFFLTTLSGILIPFGDFGLEADVYFGYKPYRIQCEVAVTPYQQSKGLMFRKKLDDYRGMLFVYDRERILTFWMKNTYIPLNIIYLRKDLTVDSCFFMKPLNDKIIYKSENPSRFALEVSPNTFQRLAVKPEETAMVELRLFYNILARKVLCSAFSP